MQSQNTPGPWEVDDDGTTVIVADGDFVADCDCYDGRSDIDTANATLISAAPELLEIVKRALKVTDYDGRLSDIWIQDAREAVAKATISARKE